MHPASIAVEKPPCRHRYRVIWRREGLSGWFTFSTRRVFSIWGGHQSPFVVLQRDERKKGINENLIWCSGKQTIGGELERTGWTICVYWTNWRATWLCSGEALVRGAGLNGISEDMRLRWKPERGGKVDIRWVLICFLLCYCCCCCYYGRYQGRHNRVLTRVFTWKFLVIQ